MKSEAKVKIKTWHFENILLEKYCYSSGTIEPIPKHSHPEYQLGITLNRPGKYYYRGAYHTLPIGELSIISSGEIHQPNDINYLPQRAIFLMMQIQPQLLQAAASEIVQTADYPFFSGPVLRDCTVANLYRQLYLTIEQKASQLTIDTCLENLLTRLVVRHAHQSPSPLKLKSVPTAIALVCDYLRTHYADNVSLAQLAQVAGLSRFYLSRLFRREMGLSLSAYQMQLRIDRAKKLLSKGMAIATIASLTGFYDQSHFTSYFKRLVGVTPANYQRQQ